MLFKLRKDRKAKITQRDAEVENEEDFEWNKKDFKKILKRKEKVNSVFHFYSQIPIKMDEESILIF